MYLHTPWEMNKKDKLKLHKLEEEISQIDKQLKSTVRVYKIWLEITKIEFVNSTTTVT